MMRIKVLGDARFRFASNVLAQSRTPIYSHTVATHNSLQHTYDSNSAVKSILLPPQHTPPPWDLDPGYLGGAASSEVAAQDTARRHSPRKSCSGSQPTVLSRQPTLPSFSLPSALPLHPTFPPQPVNNLKQENQAQRPLPRGCPKVTAATFLLGEGEEAQFP